MCLDHPAPAATNSMTKPNRIEGLGRVCGQVDRASRA
jgi:hypothetical protein